MNCHCHSHSHYLWGPHPYTVDSSSRLPSRPLYLTCTAMAADSRKTKCLAVNVHRIQVQKVQNSTFRGLPNLSNLHKF